MMDDIPKLLTLWALNLLGTEKQQSPGEKDKGKDGSQGTVSC